MKPNNSATGTSLGGLFFETGTPAGNRGSARSAALAEHVASLAQEAPWVADHAAVSWVQQHGVELHLEVEWRFPDKGPSYQIVNGCRVAGNGDYGAAERDLQAFLAPGPITNIEGWLAELSVITVRKLGNDFEDEVRLTAYASRLAQFPADVAHYALVKHPWHFWPSWAEINEVCQLWAGPRNVMLKTIRGRACRDSASRPWHGEAGERAKTPEERRAEQARRLEVSAEVSKVIADLKAKQVAWSLK